MFIVADLVSLTVLVKKWHVVVRFNAVILLLIAMYVPSFMLEYLSRDM